MHVVYHHRTRGIGVEAVHIRGIAGGLAELGHTVTVVGPPGVSLDDPSTGLLTVPERRWQARVWEQVSRGCPGALFELLEVGYNLPAFLRLRRICRRERPAAIYERYAFFNAAGLLAARACGIPFLLEVNDTAEVERERRGHRLRLRGLARAIERRVFLGASGIFTVSGYLRDELVRRGIPAGRILVTPNAIDPARFDPGRARGASRRARLGLEGRTVVGFVGSFASWHGIDLLMSVVPEVLRRHPEVTFLLVGDGRQRAMAESSVAQAGLTDRVVFAGQVPHAEVPDYLAAMDVGLMPHSNRFGSPVKIFEYMAMGIPPVGPRFGPLQEAIEDGQQGLLFEPGDAAALQTALERLLVDPDLRLRLAASARERVLSRHLWRHNAEVVAQVLGRCLAPHRAPAPPAAADPGGALVGVVDGGPPGRRL
jgi:glycosyltransferase involved in cell wall biosynthesis